MPAPTQASLKVTKTFTYRGATKTFTNRYYLNSSTGPADSAHWTTLSDAVVAAEKLIYDSAVQIIATTGYQGGSDLPIFSKTYSQNGTATFANKGLVPGDVAAMSRFTTTQRTSRNHPIYLFQWWHGVYQQSNSTGDTLNTNQQTAIQTYAQAWVTGFSDGTNTYKKSGPFGAVAQATTTQNVLRHRDFPG